MKLDPLFSPHMVLQQGIPNAIWGWGDPGTTVTVKMAGSSSETVVGADGSWATTLPTLTAGGPYSLVVMSGEERLEVSDILVGEVWVCAGQSNMEWPLSLSANAGAEIAAADYPQIRMFTVDRQTGGARAAHVNGTWRVCSPAYAGLFSAVGYYFGRDLHQKLNVPMGLIASSWGGTRAEAWTPRDALRTDPMLEPTVLEYERDEPQAAERQKEYEEKLAEWEKAAYHQDPGNEGEKKGWAKPEFNDSQWAEMSIPGAWEVQAGLRIDGAVWFRKEVEVPEHLIGFHLVLDLGAIDDFETTYFNGEEIGTTGPETRDAYRVERHYAVPARLVKRGRNVIAVRVFDRSGQGGLMGGQMALSPEGHGDAQPILLHGNWKYAVELELQPKDFDPAPETPAGPFNQNSPGVLYDSMLAPLTAFGIQGVIWYQGESNIGNANAYRRLLALMIVSWRKAWRLGDFPFYIVQLANYGPTPEEARNVEWAQLREAQEKVTEDVANTGLAVTIDIGDAQDIHPPNKRDVGSRLARLALAQTYHHPVAWQGPKYSGIKIKGDAIRISFEHAEALHTSDSLPPSGFQIADAEKVFLDASAEIDGRDVVVRAPGVPHPVAVRYGWIAGPICNLVNVEKLPAAPFRTDSWVF